jgi:hypothetical protein
MPSTHTKNHKSSPIQIRSPLADFFSWPMRSNFNWIVTKTISDEKLVLIGNRSNRPQILTS